MLNMVDTLLSFLNWVNQIISEQNITQADIARTGYVTTGAVSKLFTLQVKSVGIDMCKAVSAATGIPLETVYRKAGLLPPAADGLTDKQRETIALVETAEEEAIDMVIAMLRASKKNQQARKLSPAK